MEKGRSEKGQDLGLGSGLASVRFLFFFFSFSFLCLFVCLFVCFMFALFCCARRGRNRSSVRAVSGGSSQSQPRLACGLPREVCFTILPLQNTKGHMQAIKIIGIGLHKQRVMHAYERRTYINRIREKICVCVITNEQLDSHNIDDTM